MKYIIYILLFFPIWVTAQTYKYIGIENGLSNRRIFNIQKDTQGTCGFSPMKEWIVITVKI